MAANKDYWAKHWEARTDPDHSSDDPAYYDLIAAELLVLLRQGCFSSVLELACGNGAFYKRLGFDQGRYIGVDFSPAMIATFRDAHPGTRLEVADVRSYVPPEPVDLIFSSGLLQNLSLSEISDHLQMALLALKPEGQILHTQVPWNLLRWAFYAGIIHGRTRSRLRYFAGYVAARSGLRASIGNWHSMADIRNVALRHGLITTFYGSLMFPYRFHARMVPRG
jgi:trans-aconitate methyltransferase